MVFANAAMTMDEHGWTVVPFGMWGFDESAAR